MKKKIKKAIGYKKECPVVRSKKKKRTAKRRKINENGQPFGDMALGTTRRKSWRGSKRKTNHNNRKRMNQTGKVFISRRSFWGEQKNDAPKGRWDGGGYIGSSLSQKIKSKKMTSKYLRDRRSELIVGSNKSRGGGGGGKGPGRNLFKKEKVEKQT